MVQLHARQVTKAISQFLEHQVITIKKLLLHVPSYRKQWRNQEMAKGALVPP